MRALLVSDDLTGGSWSLFNGKLCSIPLLVPRGWARRSSGSFDLQLVVELQKILSRALKLRVGHGIINVMPGANRDPSLFEVSRKVPDGFIYHQNFVSETEEQELIREIGNLHLTPFEYYQFTGKRRTVSFGWQYEFGRSEITTAPDMPAFLFPIRARAGTVVNIDASSLVQASVIEYPTGAPIGWHRDIPHFGVVVGVSLGAPCRMRFRKYRRVRPKKLDRDEILSIELQPRSIYLLRGAARETWQHSIPPVKELRYSIIMRTLRASRNTL